MGKQMKQGNSLHLTSNKKIVLLSGRGHERYDALRDLFQQHASLLKITPEMQRYTYWFYPSVQSADVIRKEKETEIVFVPVHSDVLPLGLSIIVPPACDRELPSVLQDKRLSTMRTSYVWIEPFPFGKSETVNAIRGLEEQFQIPIERVQIRFLRGTRQFGSTDLDTEVQAVMLAKETFSAFYPK